MAQRDENYHPLDKETERQRSADNSIDIDQLHQQALVENAEFDATRLAEINEIDNAFATNPKLRRMDQLSRQIDELYGAQDAGRDPERADNLKTKLNEMLDDYRQSDKYNEAIDHLLLNRNLDPRLVSRETEVTADADTTSESESKKRKRTRKDKPVRAHRQNSQSATSTEATATPPVDSEAAQENDQTQPIDIPEKPPKTTGGTEQKTVVDEAKPESPKQPASTSPDRKTISEEQRQNIMRYYGLDGPREQAWRERQKKIDERESRLKIGKKIGEWITKRFMEDPRKTQEKTQEKRREYKERLKRRAKKIGKWLISLPPIRYDLRKKTAAVDKMLYRKHRDQLRRQKESKNTYKGIESDS